MKKRKREGERKNGKGKFARGKYNHPHIIFVGCNTFPRSSTIPNHDGEGLSAKITFPREKADEGAEGKET